MSAAAKLPRQLDATTLGVVTRLLETIRLDLRVALAHVRDDPDAEAVINAAGYPTLAALEHFQDRYRRATDARHARVPDLIRPRGVPA
jgi:hypothetical protein